MAVLVSLHRLAFLIRALERVRHEAPLDDVTQLGFDLIVGDELDIFAKLVLTKFHGLQSQRVHDLADVFKEIFVQGDTVAPLNQRGICLRLLALLRVVLIWWRSALDKLLELHGVSYQTSQAEQDVPHGHSRFKVVAEFENCR